MEYIEFGDLGEYLEAKGSAAITDATTITGQLLRGLEILHKESICHRDLKPQNVLIASHSPKLCVKIADFGLSKRAQSTMLRTQCGTAAYLAPELQGFLVEEDESEEEVDDDEEEGTYTCAVDLWSLGCLIYEVLTLRVPFYRYKNNKPTYPDSKLLSRYCDGKAKFPEEMLRKAQVSEEGIILVKGLMTAKPGLRLTATNALKSMWLYRVDHGVLRTQFLSLGVKLSLKTVVGLSESSQVGTLLKTVPQLQETDLDDLMVQAAGAGYRSIVRLMLSGGVHRSTGKALQAAVKGGYLDIVKSLLDSGADVNSWDRNPGQTALQVAVSGGHLDIVKSLLDSGAEVNILDLNTGQTALQVAAGSGHLDIVQLLLVKLSGANVMERESIQAALHTAAEGGHLEVVQLLLDKHAGLSFRAYNHSSRIALQAAANRGGPKIVELLLQRGFIDNHGYDRRFETGDSLSRLDITFKRNEKLWGL